MSVDRLKWAIPGVVLFLAGCGSEGSGSTGGGNIITGEGIPNPLPVVSTQWGELPVGRARGHTAGIDIDPIDGHIWAYERCGAGGGAAGPAAGNVNCDTNPVDPIFKFDRNTGEVLANFGDDTPGDVTGLSFPAYREEAARLLVEQRGVALLGVDTAAIDYGASADFVVHRIVAERNVAALENLTGLDALPPSGFTVFALPMRIGGGSGALVRVIALVARD